MQQQEPWPTGFVLQMDACLAIFRNIGVKEIDLPALITGKGLLDAGLTGAQGFHLRTSKHNPRLMAADNLVFVPGTAVLRHVLLRRQTLIWFLPHVALFHLTHPEQA